jgi:hypothetical protein
MGWSRRLLASAPDEPSNQELMAMGHINLSNLQRTLKDSAAALMSLEQTDQA